LLLNRAATRFGWLMNLCRTAYFMPFVTPMVSVAIVWGWMVDPQAGLLNGLLRLLGYQGAAIPWLYQPETALWVVVALQIWKLLGYTIVIFLSGLQAVPDSVYESAELDGANPWQTFWRITLPLVSPTLFFVLMMTLINAFQVFDSVYLLTQGGPEHSTDLMVYWLFKNAFEFYQVGPASAIAYILCLVILVLTLIQWQLRKKWVLYESDQ
jgi:multiple sugar transport system permease protein